MCILGFFKNKHIFTGRGESHGEWYLLAVQCVEGRVGKQTHWGQITPNYEGPLVAWENFLNIQCHLFKMQQVNLITFVKLFSCCILDFLIKFQFLDKDIVNCVVVKWFCGWAVLNVSGIVLVLLFTSIWGSFLYLCVLAFKLSNLFFPIL